MCLIIINILSGDLGFLFENHIDNTFVSPPKMNPIKYLVSSVLSLSDDICQETLKLLYLFDAVFSQVLINTENSFCCFRSNSKSR